VGERKGGGRKEKNEINSLRKREERARYGPETRIRTWGRKQEIKKKTARCSGPGEKKKMLGDHGKRGGGKETGPGLPLQEEGHINSKRMAKGGSDQLQGGLSQQKQTEGKHSGTGKRRGGEHELGIERLRTEKGAKKLAAMCRGQQS